MPSSAPIRLLALLSAAVALGGCTAGPDYVRPSVAAPAGYKEAGTWKTAEPQAADSSQPWWAAFGDPLLDQLIADAQRANQNIRQAEAAYRQAEALADQARSAFYPAVSASLGAGRARSSNSNGGPREVGSFSAGLSASWVPDLWGSVRRAVEAGESAVQASGDDLAAARLSIQAALAQDYLQLRIVDQQRDLYASTVAAYTRSLNLTQAQYRVGVALRSDVALAESQLATAQAQGIDLGVQRSQLEHAIAVLTNRPPADFSIAAAPPGRPFDANRLPAVPFGLPSELLERRPDIAAAERRVAAANAQIGVARAAYYPSLLLSASGGFGATAVASLFDAPSRVWSLGSSLAQSVFDGGLRRARDAQAVAVYDQTVAQYRQTVLNGFQQVEDNLAALRLLDEESAVQDRAVQAAQLAERLALSQYRAGTATYLSVVTAQQLSLGNQRTAVQLRGRQLAASVGLVTSTGGGWDGQARLLPAAPGPGSPDT